ncbi:alpha/beta hydrolase-fold protein [Kiritimatiellota bacterium B12222]|nr:alpha/beta hydrolase-fold protein [Kiritimatiellota bacterium B12222]
MTSLTKGTEVSDSYSVPITITYKYDYLVILPANYSPSEPLPVVLFLHGAGERGEDLQIVKKHGPFKKISEAETPVIIVAPQCPKGEYWNTEVLSGLLDEVEKKYAVDKSRIYLTGLSMGGYGAWSLAAFEPHRFAAVAPICGGGDPEDARKLVDTPVWAFHGDKDTSVKLEKGQAMIDSLKDAGGNPKFTIYEGVGHDSWTETYNNDEFYKWIFAQHLQ